MSLKNDDIVSAQVVLRPASGNAPGAQAAITSENIRNLLPSAEAIAVTRKVFVDAGLEVSQVVANSFSITGPVSAFERMLKTSLCREPGGAVKSVRADGSATLELPLEGLSKSVARWVQALTFSPPPDFGPTNY